MTLLEIYEQAKALSPAQRKELTKLIIDTLDVPASPSVSKTGAEIVALLEQMEPIEFVDAHIEDPVEWVATQRRKRQDALAEYQNES